MCDDEYDEEWIVVDTPFPPGWIWTSVLFVLALSSLTGLLTWRRNS